MTERITMRHLQRLADILNGMTQSPAEPYRRDESGNLRANIGNFHISRQNGGFCLHRMANESGGASCPVIEYHTNARHLYELTHAFIRGMEFAKQTGA